MTRTTRKINSRKVLERFLAICIAEALVIIILIVALIASCVKTSGLKKEVKEMKEQISAEAVAKAEAQVTPFAVENETVAGSVNEEESSEIESAEENIEASFYAGILAVEAAENSESEAVKASYERLEAEAKNNSVSIETLKYFNESIKEAFGEDSQYSVDLSYRFDANAWWNGKCCAELVSEVSKAYDEGKLSKELYDEYQMNVADKVTMEGCNEFYKYHLDFAIENGI